MSFIVIPETTTTSVRPQDESRDANESPRARPVTPESQFVTDSSYINDDTSDQLCMKLRTHSSPSIPIATSSKPLRSMSELRQDQDEAMADIRDYTMFTRIVDGIQKSLQMTRDMRWRHENDLSLQHVYKARNEGRNIGNDMNSNTSKQVMNKWMLSGKPVLNLPVNSLLNLMSQANDIAVPDDDDEVDDVLFVLDL